MLERLTVRQLVQPGSKWHLHRQWFLSSAMDQLLDEDFAVAAKNRLYQCLDRIEAHRVELFTHLQGRWRDLFGARYELLLYDLTSTYVEGTMEQAPKARHGYSRDKRPDCLQVGIAVVQTPEGFPLAYEVMPGNPSDKTTLKLFLQTIQTQYGKAQRIWVMDRGIRTEDTLREMRASDPPVSYLVGTPRASWKEFEKELAAATWQKVRDTVEVKLFKRGDEIDVLAKSEGRRAKQVAMRRRKLARRLRTLRALRRTRERVWQYVDGHVRVYHGAAARLPRHYVSRQRLCLRATTDYWINAMDGQPFFVVHRPVDPGLLQVLETEIIPRLEREVPNQPSAEALAAAPTLDTFILVFDREGYRPEALKRFKDRRIGCLTCHQHPGPDWPVDTFKPVKVKLAHGNEEELRLAERLTVLRNGFSVREIRHLDGSGHQTAVLATTSRLSEGAVAAGAGSRAV